MRGHIRAIVGFIALVIGVGYGASSAAPCEPGWDVSADIGSLNSEVLALTVFDDGSGPALYAGGFFTATSDGPALRIAKWDGTTWSDVGGGVSVEAGVPSVKTFMVFDDGSGSALYAGGDFTLAGGVAAHGVAKWDGSTWSPVGGGLDRSVNDLVAFDDGDGATLFAATSFLSSSESGGVWKLDGTSWTVVGGGLASSFGGPSVLALAVFDDGSGPALYAGGSFDTAGGNPALFIARWDGSSWQPVGAGFNEPVFVLHVYNAGDGPELFAGGSFLEAEGEPALAIARWNGLAWSSLGNEDFIAIDTMTIFDDGSGPALYAAGLDSFQPEGLYRFDGASWTAVARDILDGPVEALQSFDDGNGPNLYVGGAISEAGGVSRSNIAVWNGCPPPAPTIPTLSAWGYIVLSVALVVVGAYLTRRRPDACSEP